MAGKIRTNVSLRPDLFHAAREQGINLSAALEERLTELLRQRRAAEWLREHGAALEDANRLLAERGLWSDGRRLF